MAITKPSNDEMIERLVKITERLVSGQSLKVDDLAVDFETTDRTIQRDFKKLKEHLDIERSSKHWQMSKRTALDPNDMQVLEVLEKMAEGMGSVFAQRAKMLLHKLAEADLLVYASKLAMEDVTQVKQISIIEKSIKERTEIDFFYKKDEGQKPIKTWPLKMMQDNGFWYLVVYCPTDKIIKKYHLISIHAVKTSQKQFKVPTQIDTLVENAINIWFDEKNEPFIVKLCIGKEVAKYFVRKPINKSKIVSMNIDGSIEVEVTITHEMEIIPLIKQWTPHIIPSGPQNIMERLKSDTDEFYKRMTFGDACQ